MGHHPAANLSVTAGHVDELVLRLALTPTTVSVTVQLTSCGITFDHVSRQIINV